MAVKLHRLTARTAETLKAPGRHADGGGLYLSIGKTGGRRWVFLYRWQGRPVEMGLGSAQAVTLARARERAAEARAHLAEGRNPLTEKQRERAAVAEPTFGKLADQIIAAMEPSWRNPKHRDQWKSTLKTHAAPLRTKLVSQITTDDVLEVLKPLWTSRPETASRLRGRIEVVLAAAAARGFRTGINPATWRGHLQTLLPKRSTLTRGHFAALPYADMGSFMEALRARAELSARALELAILTAARSGEVRGARWGEFDLAGKIWTVPAERMKAGRVHRVPLSGAAVAILEAMTSEREGDNLVFPGGRPARPMSDMTLLKLLDRMGYGQITAHGFRSAFRDWASEQTTVQREVAEAALAHVVKDRTEAAYRRGDLFDKRRVLMEAWASYCLEPKDAKILPLVRATA